MNLKWPFSQTMFGDKVNKSGYVGGLLGMAKVYPIEIEILLTFKILINSIILCTRTQGLLSY